MKLKNRILLILAFSILLLFFGSIIFVTFSSMNLIQLIIHLAIIVSVVWAVMYIYDHVNY